MSDLVLLEGQGEEQPCRRFYLRYRNRNWECYVNSDHSFILLEYEEVCEECGDAENGPQLNVEYNPVIRATGIDLEATMDAVKFEIDKYLYDELM